MVGDAVRDVSRFQAPLQIFVLLVAMIFAQNLQHLNVIDGQLDDGGLVNFSEPIPSDKRLNRHLHNYVGLLAVVRLLLALVPGRQLAQQLGS